MRAAATEALGDGKNPVFWASTEQGTYKQPDNLRRLKRQAIKDFGRRQFKKSGVLRQYNIAQQKVNNA